jgi:hypothetical protein
MSVFHHPHLTRGIVKTPKGSFVIVRGLVEAPDEIGESLGWHPVELAAPSPAAFASPSPRERTLPASDEQAPVRASSLKETEREARARMIRAKAARIRSRLHGQPSE